MKSNDNSVKDLVSQEAVEKMKELVEHTKVCFFTTHLDNTPLPTRPMHTQEVDDEGTLWFFSDEESEKNFEIKDDSRVQLLYANPSKMEFLSIYGHAMVSRDRSKIEQLWSPMAKAWFKGGKDDPSLSVIQVIPDEAYYWDTKHNKMVSFLKILSSIGSDSKSKDDGVQGRLKM
ncbi:MAG TPA: pyridoxamine 5'-phosphate oxidase family protein [Chryseosolibacter sp.]